MMPEPAISRVLKALADPTRRSVYEAIVQRGELTVGEVVQGLHVTQPAVSQHLRTLERAGLVVQRKQGRNVHYRNAPGGLQPLGDWLALYADFWRERFDKLEHLLKEMN